MLRYFYLVCLLICIKRSFCYDYISEQDSYRPGRKLRKDTKPRHRIEDRHLENHEYEDSDPVAQIDVASFIQKPDYDASIEENYSFQNRHTNGRDVSKDYGDYRPVPQHGIEYAFHGKGKDHPNLDAGSSVNYNIRPDLENPNAKSGYNENYSSDGNDVHKHQKKSTIKQMNFPFFSHKKTVTRKPKKNKKRKLFCLSKNCSNKVPKPSESKVNNDIKSPYYDLYKIKKRSYEERVCPLCNSKFIINSNNGLPLDSKIDSSKLIHNSRQFYQDVSNIPKEKGKEDMSHVNNDAMDSDSFEERNKEENSVDIDYREDRRRKRDDEKERQMKELEEVQKKIDAVEVQSLSTPEGQYHVTSAYYFVT